MVRKADRSETKLLRSAAALAALLMPGAPTAAAEHSFEFVAEHLPEVAMDNRFSTLPLWSGAAAAAGQWQFTLQGGFARTTSGAMALDGPMLSAAARRQLDQRWAVQAFGFFDELQFSSSGERRPLETLFARPPLALPAEALFTDLGGTYRNMGAGLAFSLQADGSWFGRREWVIGTLYQSVELRDYRATYQVLDGPSTGTTGVVDYSATYQHLTPFAGIALPRESGPWRWTAHTLLAIPLPRRGLQGRITGPGFDLSGDTDSAGNGKHFGDVSLTFGLDVTYKPWGHSVDLGSMVTQALLEPLIHKGIDRNWVISAYKQF
jgi:hypothetical protein